MKAQRLWNERHLRDDKSPRTIYALTFSPNGERLVCAAGARVLVYEATKGALVANLQAHRDEVYALSYSKDGRFFASAGKDKQVICWSSVTLDGKLRYNHPDSLQAVEFNPQTGQLASCSCTDLALVQVEASGLSRHKVPSRVLTCSWTSDGQYLALGHQNGLISIRNKVGDEKVKIERPGNSPVWSLSWHPTRDHIVAGDWGQRISFYALNGSSAGRERKLDYDPTCVSYFLNGEYMLVGGCNRKASVHAKDGTMLTTITEQPAWVWCCKQQPGTHNLAVGCQDGSISLFGLQFATVHSLYKDRYAHRESMTDVIVQHLPTDQKTRIRCKELVKRLSVYRNRLAIQLPSSILVYELKGDMNEIQYKLKDRVNLQSDCNLLVVCAEHIILCYERRLQSYDISKGQKVREWAVDSFIRYIKVIGGPAGAEGLLCGLRSGEVVKIYLDNPFVISVMKMKNAIRCLDINANHTKVAVVDESNLLQVYNLSDNKLLFQEPGAASVSWNTQNEDMLCYSGNGVLLIKTANFPPHQQKLQGYVVGFSGSKVFCLQGASISSVDVPQSASLYQFLEKKMYKEAYGVACLGVTTNDWRALAGEALEGLDFTTARKAYVRVRDLKFLELLTDIEERQKRGENNNDVFLGDIYAYQGRFAEASHQYEMAGEVDKAVEMYTDLRMFDKAKDVVKRNGKKSVLNRVQRQEAEWFKTIDDPRAACDMYVAVGEYKNAINIMARQNWIDQLVQLVRQLPAEKADELRLAAKVFMEAEDQAWESAIEVYRKLDDVEAQVKTYIAVQHWDTVLEICEDHPEMKEKIYLPYANWLAEHNRFEEAQRAFRQAGRDKEAVRVLCQLIDNAISETRFGDAGYYNLLLAVQHRDTAGEEDTTEDERQQLLDRFLACRRNAELYYVYDKIYSYMKEPVTKHTQQTLLNMCRFMLLESDRLPRGILKGIIFYTMAKQCRDLGGFRAACFCYEQLQRCVLPREYQKIVERDSFTIRARGMHDKQDLTPLCFRCSTSTPLLHNLGRKCPTCQQPLVYDFTTFDLLPLVEFVLEAGISDEEALRLIQTEPPRKKEATDVGGRDFDGIERLTIMPAEDHGTVKDKFSARMAAYEADGMDFQFIVADREMLRSFDPREVLIRRWKAPRSWQYYKDVVKEHNVTLCQYCNEFFSMDEYCVNVLEKQCCPYCRHTVNVDEPVPITRY
ncbi:intraflagellar transport protein 122 homolog [Sycon ciliatum]|uniref:intraflagellar transport protein 122 homolog n=1 Tax=Sycon ciliatum TaxID=27933 RepID=UPI0020A90221|eukprot:scpid24643/ scgid9336/ Intraflagellar transport protein 122 homolog